VDRWLKTNLNTRLSGHMVGSIGGWKNRPVYVSQQCMHTATQSYGTGYWDGSLVAAKYAALT